MDSISDTVSLGYQRADRGGIRNMMIEYRNVRPLYGAYATFRLNGVGVLLSWTVPEPMALHTRFGTYICLVFVKLRLWSRGVWLGAWEDFNRALASKKAD